MFLAAIPRARYGSLIASLYGCTRGIRTRSLGYEPSVLPLDDQCNGDPRPCRPVFSTLRELCPSHRRRWGRNARFHLNLHGVRTFDPCGRLIIASISGGEYPHLKVDLDLSTSPKTELQMVVATYHFNGAVRFSTSGPLRKLTFHTTQHDLIRS